MLAPTLKLEDVPNVVNEVSGLIARVTKADGSDLHSSHEVDVECVPMADGQFLYMEDNPVRIPAPATAESGFRAFFTCSALPAGFIYMVTAYSKTAGHSLAKGFRKEGRKQACPNFDEKKQELRSAGPESDTGMPITRLVLFPLTDPNNVPHNADFQLRGSINPYVNGMTLSAYRAIVGPTGPTDEQSVSVSIDGTPVDGQQATYTVVIGNAQLDPSINYTCRVIADVPHQPAYIPFRTRA